MSPRPTKLKNMKAVTHDDVTDEHINTLRECIGIQLRLILEDAIENQPDVLVKIQSMSKEVEIQLAQDGDVHNHLVELAKAHSFSAWVIYRSRSDCCRCCWMLLRLLLISSIGSLVAYLALEGLGIFAVAWQMDVSRLSSCFLSAILQPNSLCWSVCLGLAAALAVFLLLPQEMVIQRVLNRP